MTPSSPHTPKPLAWVSGLVLLGIFGITLAGGLKLSRWTTSFSARWLNPSPATATLTPPPTATPGRKVALVPPPEETNAKVEDGQVSLLIAGVDDLNATNGDMALKAVWLILFHPPAPQVFLLGLSPASLAVLPDGATFRLQDVFLQEGGQIVEGGQFLSGLQALTSVTPTASIVLDRTAFLEVARLTGGAVIAGQTLTADETLALLDAAEAAGPVDRLAAQSEILFGMAQAATLRSNYPDPAVLVLLAPSHARLSPSLAALLAFAANILPLAPENLHILDASTEAALSNLPGGEVAVVLSKWRARPLAGPP